MGVDPMGLLRLLRRPVTERWGFPDGVRAAMGTGGGRARPASCCGGLDMAGEKRGPLSGREGDGESEGRKGDILMAVGWRIGAQDQFKFAVRLGFIIPSRPMTSLSCRR